VRYPRYLVPLPLRGYQRTWLGPDIIAGLTLSAVAIPEVMGYTSITQTPIVTGLYTLLIPLAIFSLIGASRLLVVGGDSATAAILAAGLAAAALPGATPGSARWTALAGVTALVAGAMLVVARLLRLGFLGDFLSASVIIGFLSGVGIQVATGQIPDILGVQKGSGGWIKQQWSWLHQLDAISWATLAYGGATIVIVLACRRFAPRAPGVLIAVVALLGVATATSASTHGVAVVGATKGGLPPLGLPAGLSLADVRAVVPTALACAFIVIAQSAATSRSFAMKRGESADVNRDILGLAVANIGAGLSGSFVVNGSPTKTEVLDEARGRTQVANLVVAAMTLIVVLFLTGLLEQLPLAVLGAVVLLIGVELVDVRGLRRISRRRRAEFIVAVITMATVFLFGVGLAILVAIVLSLLEVIQRQYLAPAHVMVPRTGGYDYLEAVPGVQSRPGLIVYHFDSRLFFANATAFTERLERVVEGAPDRVRWVIIDCSGIADVDYSAGDSLIDLVAYLHARSIHVVLARPEPSLLETFAHYDLLSRISADHVYGDLDVAIEAFTEDGAGRSGGESTA
jgi:high affinity sulfate transporter 1